MLIENKRVVSSLAWFGILLPFILFAWGFYQVQFAGDILYYGAEPGKAIVHQMGQWALGFLLVVIGVAPLRSISVVNLVPVRRRLGLAVFTFSSVHLLAYLLLLLGLEFSELSADIQKRPYILLGFSAFLLLIPLAVTSSKNWQRRLRQNWKRLHKLVYVVVALVLMHIWWQVKAGFALALISSVIAAVIISIRIRPYLLASFKSSSNL
jgi:sulfoxide reductase heme-binding subunit YedZ